MIDATVVTSQAVIPRLPRSVYVFQSGLVINAFGNGAVNPFIVVYLHEVRGIPLGLAGLAGSTSASLRARRHRVVRVWSADRSAPAGRCSAGSPPRRSGFALYPLIREAWEAIVLAGLAGAGTGTLADRPVGARRRARAAELRHVAFAQQRVAANLGLGLGGFAGGLIITLGDPASFTRLFLLDAATFAAYGVVLLFVPGDGSRVQSGGGYRVALRDRPFLGVVALNIVWVASTVALLNSLFPVFAHEQSGVSTHAIGVLFLVNSLTIVALQLPVSRAVEGHRRTRASG